MYSQKDIETIEKKLKKFILYFAVITVVFLVILILICINWGTKLDPFRLPAWPAYLTGIIYAVFTVFTWSTVGAKLIKYLKFVKSIMTGLERQVKGKVMLIDNIVKYDNDLEFYSIEIKEEDAQESRLLRLDAVKDISLFEKDRIVKVIISGNYIKDIVS